MKKTMKMILILVVMFHVQGTGTGTGIGVALAEEVSKINIHGYLSQGFLISTRNNFVLDSKKGTFNFNELALNFTSQLTDRIHVGIQFAARDLGDKGNDKVIIDWAFADYTWCAWLGLRVGKMKLAEGFYNKARDIDMLRTFIFLPQSVYPENYRDTATSMKGIGLYGVVSPGSLGNISYEASAGTGEIDLDGGTIDLFESFADVNITKANVGRLINFCLFWETPLKGLRAGYTLLNVKVACTGAITKDIAVPVDFPPYTLTLAWKGDIFKLEGPKYQINVFSVEYTWNNLVLAAEYLKMRQETDIKVIDRYKADMLLIAKNYYISGTYRFSEKFESGIYYSAYSTDLDSKIVPQPVYPYLSYQKDLCVAFRFDLNSHWIFKVEGHLMKGAAICYPKYNLNDAGVPVFARRWALFGAKLTYTF